MNTRANYQALSAASFRALLSLEKTLADSSIGSTIMHLVKIRASQLNGCLYCLDMHSKEAKKSGERELRLYHLPLWRESSLFSLRERAALEWTELLTPPDPHGVSDAAYARVEAQFSEKEISDLTLAVAAINAWNRLGIAFQPVPGSLDKLMGLENLGLE